eukprot:304914-Hanusia_phi.AAC.1
MKRTSRRARSNQPAAAAISQHQQQSASSSSNQLAAAASGECVWYDIALLIFPVQSKNAMDQFSKEMLRIGWSSWRAAAEEVTGLAGTLQGFKHFKCYLRGREELLVTIPRVLVQVNLLPLLLPLPLFSPSLLLSSTPSLQTSFRRRRRRRTMQQHHTGSSPSAPTSSTPPLLPSESLPIIEDALLQGLSWIPGSIPHLLLLFSSSPLLPPLLPPLLTTLQPRREGDSASLGARVTCCSL